MFLHNRKPHWGKPIYSTRDITKNISYVKKVNVRNPSKPLKISNYFMPVISMKLRFTTFGGMGKENIKERNKWVVLLRTKKY